MGRERERGERNEKVRNGKINFLICEKRKNRQGRHGRQDFRDSYSETVADGGGGGGG